MPIRVVFLTFYFEAWDSFAQIWHLMVEDERFDPIVVTIPRKLTGDGEFTDQAVHGFFEDHGIPHQRFNFKDSMDGLARLKELAPDYVFLNYPWRRNYQPGYRAENLIPFTKVAYVPYFSLPLVNEPGETGVAGHLYRQRTHQLASLVFTQDAASIAAYAETDRGNGYVHLTGSAKIDALMRDAAEGSASWPIQQAKPAAGAIAAPRKYRVVWAPHHSYGTGWLNFGIFAQMYQQMLRFARQHSDVEVVLRPHPFLFGTLVDRGVLSKKQMDDWLEDWKDLTNTAIHTDGSYAELFKACDLLVTDGISFIGEYPLVTGKPTVFLENPGHWDFSPLGQIAAAANIRLTNFDGFETLFEQIRTDGLPDYSEEIALLRKAASPYPGQAASRIVDLVADDFAAGTPLVDPTLIKQVAWEFRPEAEPQLD